MSISKLLTIPLTLVAALLLGIAPAAADDVSVSDSDLDFTDRDLLVETLDRYGDTALADAQSDLADAEQALADATAAGDLEEVDRLTNEVIPPLAEEVTRNENFDTNVQAIVDTMSDEQVVAMNRSLQNTRSNGIVPTMGLDEIQRIVDESFDGHQIQAYVMAYRENAKFLAKADRFEVDSKQHDRFVAKAESQQAKFLAKVDRFGDSDGADGLTASLAAKQARAQARAAAKASADAAVADSAHGLAKNEARRSAKAQAVKLAKQDRSNDAKGLAKGKKK